MTTHELRSRNWFGRSDLDGFVHRSWLKAEGFKRGALRGGAVHVPLLGPHVLQASEGCDFDYLRGATPVRREDTAGPSHT